MTLSNESGKGGCVNHQLVNLKRDISRFSRHLTSPVHESARALSAAKRTATVVVRVSNRNFHRFGSGFQFKRIGLVLVRFRTAKILVSI